MELWEKGVLPSTIEQTQIQLGYLYFIPHFPFVSLTTIAIKYLHRRPLRLLQPIYCLVRKFSPKKMNESYEVVAGQGKVLVGYVTDIEGNLDYWNKYLAISKVVSRNMTTNKLELKENCQFVYGGDVCDRGNGDIRILKDLISLKKSYPDRVHFILGNRDVNKLRLPVALHNSVLAYPPQCYWMKTDLPTQDPLYQFNEIICKMKWVSIVNSFFFSNNFFRLIFSCRS